MDQEKITRFFNEGNYWEALNYLKENSKQEKHILSDWYLGNVYFKLHQYSKALEHILNFISVKKKDPLNLNFLGEIYLEMNHYKKANEVFNEIIKIEPTNKAALLNLAKINLNIGNLEQSENFYKTIFENDQKNLSYIYSLSRINNEYLSDEILNKIEKKNLTYINQIYLKLILARKFELNKDYKKEIENLSEAHRIYLLNKEKALNQQFNFHSKLLPEFMDKLKSSKVNSFKGFKPIFITGLPRSGTTLVERIIVSGKKNIQSLGETDVFDKVFFSNQIIKNQKNILQSNFNFLIEKILNQYKEQGLNNQNDLFTDKSITNFLYIELINKIFPNAKFIYCSRNPLANIIGIFRSFLPSVYWSHSLEKIFSISELYLNRLNNLKKDNLKNLLIINLEDLTNDPINVSKNLYKFLNLDWSKKCLESNNKNLIIKTASNLQARNEIKKHDLDYIKSYSKILKELGFKNKLLI